MASGTRPLVFGCFRRMRGSHKRCARPTRRQFSCAGQLGKEKLVDEVLERLRLIVERAGSRGRRWATVCVCTTAFLDGGHAEDKIRCSSLQSESTRLSGRRCQRLRYRRRYPS